MDNIDDCEISDDEDEQEDEQEDEHEREIRAEWMLLAEMGPNTAIDNYSDLGSREMDRNYDWAGEFRRQHPNINIADVTNFLQQSRKDDNIEAENPIVNMVDIQTLILAIWHRLLEITKNHNPNIKSPILVIAPTGIAAFNIHGATVHSALFIPVNSTNFDISGERLN